MVEVKKDGGDMAPLWTSGTTFDLSLSMYGMLFPHHSFHQVLSVTTQLLP